MKKSTKIVDIICFVIGPLLLVIFLFGFEHRGLIGSGYANPLYYPLESRIGIGIGVVLICIGFLRRYWRKKDIFYDDKK